MRGLCSCGAEGIVPYPRPPRRGFNEKSQGLSRLGWSGEAVTFCCVGLAAGEVAVVGCVLFPNAGISLSRSCMCVSCSDVGSGFPAMAFSQKEQAKWTPLGAEHLKLFVCKCNEALTSVPRPLALPLGALWSAGGGLRSPCQIPSERVQQSDLLGASCAHRSFYKERSKSEKVRSPVWPNVK